VGLFKTKAKGGLIVGACFCLILSGWVAMLAMLGFIACFTYWIYSAMGLAAAWFIWKWVPETRGRSLEEIESFWKANSFTLSRSGENRGEEESR